MNNNEIPFPNADDTMQSGTNPQKLMMDLDQDIKLAGGEFTPPSEFEGSVGVTMFDAQSSKDNLVTVVVPKDHLADLPSQTLVKIGHPNYGDKRVYQGIVVEGPFYEPDGLRADSSIIVTTAVNGLMFMPNYHGRVMVEILKEQGNGQWITPRFRPLPNSPVFSLGVEATKEALKVDGDISIGQVIGMEDIDVAFPSDSKAVLPRHLGILGTTGGGKSTTVSGLVKKLQESNVATILIDTEGEYTQIFEETEDPNMIAALRHRGLEPGGVKNVRIMKLVGRDTSCDDPSKVVEFGLTFENLSPYAIVEILELNDAQEDRYLKAYEIARKLLRELRIFPTDPKNDEQRKELIDLDELEKSYPRLRLEMMYDIVQAIAKSLDGSIRNEDNSLNIYLRTPEFYQNNDRFIRTIEAETNSKAISHPKSWYKVQGALAQLLRLNIFDVKDKSTGRKLSIDYNQLTHPGSVTILDLGDTDSPYVNNLVIAELLRGTLDKQNETYELKRKGKIDELQKVMVIIEEAHEFLSRERISQMPVLKQQVARIARRGRKRWLGLTFVTQLPQHLPDEMLSLINSYILHKIGDANVISRLKRSIGGVDESLWRRLPGLAAGQAIVTTPSLSRALLVAIDPTPCKLLMVD
jgi:DNA helicase HerA-like ATPase